MSKHLDFTCPLSPSGRVLKDTEVTDAASGSLPAAPMSLEDALSKGYALCERNSAAALDHAQGLLRQTSDPRVYELAASALRKLGRSDLAEQAEISAIKASFAVPILDDAAVAGHDGRTAASRALLERFLDKQPGNLLALTMIAEIDLDEWRVKLAEERLRVILERAPSFLRAIMLLGKCLTSQTRAKEAIDLLEAVRERKPRNLTVLRALAQLYSEANQHERSAETHAQIVSLDASNLDSWIMYAQELRMLGRKAESKAAFREAIKLDPNSGAAWWGLANYFASNLSAADITLIQRALANRKDNPEDGGPLHIALAVISESRGDYSGAFRHVAAGKALRMRQHAYDSAQATRNVDDLIGTMTAELFSTSSAGGFQDRAPIFIIGMPRSGTTLLERILSRHPRIEAGGELPVMPRIESRITGGRECSLSESIACITPEQLTALGKSYSERSRDYRTSRKPRFIDKLNYNWSRLGLIRLILPQAQIIDLRRDALDCCWSNYKMMFADGHAAANDQRTIARFYRDYVRMVEAVDTASPGAILQVRYEDLVDNQEQETRRILTFLGLDYDAACLDFHLSTAAVATPSSEQVRRPINRDSIGSAQPYREWLGPMIEELGDLIG